MKLLEKECSGNIQFGEALLYYWPMKTDTLHIKNMVCGRCIKVVREAIEQLGYPVKQIELGKVVLDSVHETDDPKLKAVLTKEGFELIDDNSSRIISKIKILIVKQVHHESGETGHQNLSAILEKEIGKSYSALSALFSKSEGRTIEKYVISQRIERVKELLVYGEKTISEIAWELGYSSTQYLSNQFKSETGLTPTQFRKLITSGRKPLDKV